MTLPELILQHSRRTACRCPSCPPTSRRPLPEPFANLVFFDVALVGEITAADFITAVKEAAAATASAHDPFDGQEHSSEKLGRWLGEQELALRLMGIGALLKVWDLLTPFTEFGDELPQEFALQMAQAGLLAIQARTKDIDLRKS